MGLEAGRFLKGVDGGQIGEGFDQFRRILVGESLRAVGMEDGRSRREAQKTLLGDPAEAGGIFGVCLAKGFPGLPMMRVSRESERQPDVGIKEHDRGVGGHPD